MSRWLTIVTVALLLAPGKPSNSDPFRRPDPTWQDGRGTWMVQIHAVQNPTNPDRLNVQMTVDRSRQAPLYTNRTGTEDRNGITVPVWNVTLYKPMDQPRSELYFVLVRLNAPEPGKPLAGKPLLQTRNIGRGRNLYVNLLPPRGWQLPQDSIQVMSESGAVRPKVFTNTIPHASLENPKLIRLTLLGLEVAGTGTSDQEVRIEFQLERAP